MLKVETEGFELSVRKHFAFLGSQFGFRYAGLNVADQDPRDSYVVAKYRHDELRVDVVWNPYAKSLGVLIRLNNSDLKRRERYVYLEPFTEFLSGGKITPIIPQICPKMGVGMIKKAMHSRDELFSNGFDRTIQIVAERLKTYLPDILGSSPETIRKYQSWYQSYGGTERCENEAE